MNQFFVDVRGFSWYMSGRHGSNSAPWLRAGSGDRFRTRLASAAVVPGHLVKQKHDDDRFNKHIKLQHITTTLLFPTSICYGFWFSSMFVLLFLMFLLTSFFSSGLGAKERSSVGLVPLHFARALGAAAVATAGSQHPGPSHADSGMAVMVGTALNLGLALNIMTYHK